MPNPIYLESLNNYETTLNTGKDLYAQFLLAIQQKAQSFIPEPVSYPPVEYLGATLQDTTPFEKLFEGKTKTEGNEILQQMTDWFSSQFEWFNSIKPLEQKFPTKETFNIAFENWSNEIEQWKTLQTRLLTVAGEIIKKIPVFIKPEGAEILNFKTSDLQKLHSLFDNNKTTWETKSIQELENAKKQAALDYSQWELNLPKLDSIYFPSQTEKTQAEQELNSIKTLSKQLLTEIKKEIDNVIAAKAPVLEFPPITFIGTTSQNLSFFLSFIGSMSLDTLNQFKQSADEQFEDWKKKAPSHPKESDYPNNAEWEKAVNEYNQKFQEAQKLHDDIIKALDDEISKKGIQFPKLEYYGIEPSNLNSYMTHIEELLTNGTYTATDIVKLQNDAISFFTDKIAEVESLSPNKTDTAPEVDKWRQFQESVNNAYNNLIFKSMMNQANTKTQTPPTTSEAYTFKPSNYQGGQYFLIYKNFRTSTVHDFSLYLRTLPTEKDVLSEKDDLDSFLNGSLEEWESYSKDHLSKSEFDSYQKRLISQINEFREIFTKAINKEIDRRKQMAPTSPKDIPQYNGTGKKQVSEFSPDISYFPKDVAETSETNLHLDGSTGAKMVEDSNGNHFIMKKGNSPEHLKSECYADAFYQAAGIKVPAFKLYDVGGEPVKLSAELKNAKSLDDWWQSASGQEREDMRKKLRQGYAADVLLGNWDVVGMNADNILIDEKGEPWRINNGGSLKFRAQGAIKTPESWEKHIDDLFTMTGNGSAIGSNESSTITKFYGPIRPLELAKEINEQDWTKALSTLPPDEKKVVENRLEEIRQLAERGADAEHFGRTPESTDRMLAYSYQYSKDGLREALPKKFDINSAQDITNWRESGGWFSHGNTTRTLNGKDYESLGEYLADKMGEENFNFIQEANRAQGDDSYSPESIQRKLCILKSKGIDFTDPKYKTFNDFERELQKEGYYCGTYPDKQWQNFKDTFDQSRQDVEKFEKNCQALDQYDAMVQILLENVEMKNVDPKTRTYMLCRTEDNGVLGKTKIGEEVSYNRGVCESHFRIVPVAIHGQDSTVICFPFSRVHGIWPIERGRVENGKYIPEHNPQFGPAKENESVGDSQGLPSIFGGVQASVEELHKVYKEFVKNHPDKAITGVHSK